MEHDNSPDLLADLNEEVQYEHAPKGLRFVNLLIDWILLSIVSGGVAIVYMIFYYAAYIRDTYNQYEGPAAPSGTAVAWLYAIIFAIYILYYTIMEAATNGRTVGKYVTGTMAVREDGARITWKDAFFRSICRFIPFEFVIALFIQYPWHDDFTRTAVVRRA
ncbi:RDD family protein [Pseudoflavitalea sp. G-6-1-2]|uniref:RDD family protein n=1 Tax=Pseudoflavitalea sp. G-6-1-2 TaxID=2728841 RepID=UPI00146C74BC|nr:RDD family protein [Pseudoflavitalea sp. G-6-1-2]NML20185.1 RDD family protein [Pseudoflavitalea sp. G-6-1-2]